MKTTAQLRTEARAAEKALDWTTAAALYGQAVECYPNPAGALAQLDIAKLTQVRDACRREAMKGVRFDIAACGNV